MAHNRGGGPDQGGVPDPRTEYDEQQRRETEGAGRTGPSPYDVAPEGMPDERVITKGEREKPGPTAAETGPDAGSPGDHSESHVSGTRADQGTAVGPYRRDRAPDDEDARETPAPPRMSGSLEEDDASEANDETGTLGGEALHRRINDEAIRDDMLGDEESA